MKIHRSKNRFAQREFKDVKTMNEEDLEQGWPRLRAALVKALINFRDKLKS